MIRAALFALSYTLAALPTQAEAPSSVTDEITHIEDQWRKARIDGDTAFLEHFYAKDARIQWMNGKVQSRDEDIALFATGKVKPKFIDHGPLNISIYGQTAVVTGVDHLGGTAFGQYREMYLRFTDVLVNEGETWQLVVQQTTPTDGP